MTKKIESIRDLTPDQINANKHSQRGMGMMETSITECGFGDSLTVDKNGNVISGNGRLETLAAIDMSDAIVVQSDGTRAVIHQRLDLDLTTDAKAKRLALLQNRVGQTNLDWDAQVLAELAEQGVELDDLFSTTELSLLLNDYEAANDPNAEWKGMPEFEQDDQSAWKTIKVHFDSEKDLLEFAKRLGQTVTDKTRYIWFPHKADISSAQFTIESAQ